MNAYDYSTPEYLTGETCKLAKPVVTHYHAGWNMVGYLPEMDPSYPFESFTDARSSLLEDLDRFAEHAYNADDETQAEDLDTYARDLAQEDGPGWDAFVGHMHYWIVACAEEECLEEEEYAR